MSVLQSSQRPHEESQRAKGAGERVWMEALEGRVLLSADAHLDLSHPNYIQGSGSITYSFEAKAGERYLFIDLDGNEIHLFNSDHRQLAYASNDMVSRIAWRAPHDGTYSLWIEAAYRAEDYDYELIARAASDDFGDDRFSATPLHEGRPIHGEIEDVLDYDVFEFHGEAGVRFAFNPGTGGDPFGEDDSNIWVSVYDDHGHDASLSNDGSKPMPYTGTYYVVVSTDWTVGKYTLTASQVSDDHEGGAESAVPFTIGVPTMGTIDFEGDHDWYSFQATEGTNYTFELKGGPEYARMVLFPADAPGDWGQANYDNDYQGRLEWTAPADGLCVIEVSPMYGGYYQTPYVLNSAVREDTKAVQSIVRPPLVPGSLVESSMQRPGESQYFPFAAKAHVTYTVQLEEGSLPEGVVVGVLAADGMVKANLIARLKISDDAYGLQLRWTAPEDGPYYLWVRGFNPLAKGTYGMTLVEEPDDHGNSLDSATPIVVGQAILGDIQYDVNFWDSELEQDTDWFGFDAVEGEQYVINLDRLSAPSVHGHREQAGLNDLNLMVLDADGNAISGIDPGYLSGGKLEWTAPSSGRFYLRAGSPMRVQYRVLVTAAENDPEPARAMMPGEVVRGQLAYAGEAQRLRIDVEAGQSYALDIRGGSEWKMVPTDAAYKWFEPIRAGCHAHVWKAEESGSYFIEFYAYWWGSPERYTVGFSKYDGPLDGKDVECSPLWETEGIGDELADDSGDELADDSGDESADDSSASDENESDEESSGDELRADVQSPAADGNFGDEEDGDDGGGDWLRDDYQELDFSDENLDWGNL